MQALNKMVLAAAANDRSLLNSFAVEGLGMG